MEKCKDCEDWSPIQQRDGYGFCKSKKWNRHPNYYTDSDRVTEIDMAEITYTPITGKDFGCIHHNSNC